MEIRTVTVMLIDAFDVQFAPGEDGMRLHKETLDCFAAIPGPLKLVFKRRTPEAIITDAQFQEYAEDVTF
jgi:hypothetical protein